MIGWNSPLWDTYKKTWKFAYELQSGDEIVIVDFDDHSAFQEYPITVHSVRRSARRWNDLIVNDVLTFWRDDRVFLQAVQS